jgi:hypothetical protein
MAMVAKARKGMEALFCQLWQGCVLKNLSDREDS